MDAIFASVMPEFHFSSVPPSVIISVLAWIVGSIVWIVVWWNWTETSETSSKSSLSSGLISSWRVNV